MNVKDERSLKRWRLIYSLRVFEVETDQLYGHLVDISDKGMMLVTENAVASDQDHGFWMEVPQESGEMQRVELTAHSVWLSKDDETSLYRAGFKLVNVDPLLLVSIRCIIDDLKLDN